MWIHVSAPLPVQAMLDPISLIFGRTGLIIGASEAKNAREADFDVKMRVALQKPGQNCENHVSKTQFFFNFSNFCFFNFFMFFGVPSVVGG